MAQTMPRCTVLAMLSYQPLIRIRHELEVTGTNTNDVNAIYASVTTFAFLVSR